MLWGIGGRALSDKHFGCDGQRERTKGIDCSNLQYPSAMGGGRQQHNMRESGMHASCRQRQRRTLALADCSAARGAAGKVCALLELKPTSVPSKAACPAMVHGNHRGSCDQPSCLLRIRACRKPGCTADRAALCSALTGCGYRRSRRPRHCSCRSPSRRPGTPLSGTR